MRGHCYELDRERVAAEALCHAIELFDRDRNPALVMAVGQVAWQYYYERARSAKRGRHATSQIADVVRGACGDAFDGTWLRQRALELRQDLERTRLGVSGPQRLRISALSPLLLLVCAVADSGNPATRDAALDEWRQLQLERALQACLSDPDVVKRREAIGAVRDLQSNGVLGSTGT
jgi:hypothetical protein